MNQTEASFKYYRAAGAIPKIKDNYGFNSQWPDPNYLVPLTKQHRVQILHIETPKKFYVLSVEAKQEALTFLKNIKKYFTSRDINPFKKQHYFNYPNFNLEDSLCLVHYKDDYYRGSILQLIEPDLFKILLVDVGESVFISSYQIVPLPRELATIPFRAHPLELEGILDPHNGWSLPQFEVVYTMFADKNEVFEIELTTLGQALIFKNGRVLNIEIINKFKELTKSQLKVLVCALMLGNVFLNSNLSIEATNNQMALMESNNTEPTANEDETTSCSINFNASPSNEQPSIQPRTLIRKHTDTIEFDETMKKKKIEDFHGFPVVDEYTNTNNKKLERQNDTFFQEDFSWDLEDDYSNRSPKQTCSRPDISDVPACKKPSISEGACSITPPPKVEAKGVSHVTLSMEALRKKREESLLLKNSLCKSFLIKRICNKKCCPFDHHINSTNYISCTNNNIVISQYRTKLKVVLDDINEEGFIMLHLKNYVFDNENFYTLHQDIATSVHIPLRCTPLLGEMVIAKYSDKYYRAIVLEYQLEGLVELWLIDIGRKIVKKCSELKIMQSKWLNYPPQALECALINARLDKAQKNIHFIKNIYSNREGYVIFFNYNREECQYDIKLEIDAKDFGETLILKQLAKPHKFICQLSEKRTIFIPG